VWVQRERGWLDDPLVFGFFVSPSLFPISLLSLFHPAVLPAKRSNNLFFVLKISSHFTTIELLGD
jgi:hypothetical protein